MADNTARARDELKGQRRAVADHVNKYQRYTDKTDKDFALKTIRNAQAQITRLRAKHPTLSHDASWEDTWRP